jgi:hypothetical protein
MLDRCTFAAGLIAAPVTRRFGRRLTMVVGECMQLCWMQKLNPYVDAPQI